MHKGAHMHNNYTQFRTASIAVIVATTLTACVGTFGATTAGTALSGNSFHTEASCKRTQPLGKFDAGCDQPVLGIKDFHVPTSL